MNCPVCQNTNTYVINSRPIINNTKVKRRRECIACKQRFTTVEVIIKDMNRNRDVKLQELQEAEENQELQELQEKQNIRDYNTILHNLICCHQPEKITGQVQLDIKKLIAALTRNHRTFLLDTLRENNIIHPIPLQTRKLRKIMGHNFIPRNEIGTFLVLMQHFDNWFNDIIDIQVRCPDLLLIEKITLKKVTAELEYKSSNFKKHKHNPQKCDMVICWEHDCELPIPVLELKSKRYIHPNY